MKRVFSLALAALLLAGCTAAQSDGDTAGPAVTAQTATAQEAESTAATPTPAEPLRPLRAGDAKQYYMTEMLSGGLIRYWVADLTAHETSVPCTTEGCTHDTEDCPATFRRGECDGVYVLDDNTLVAFTNNHFPETEDSQVILLDRNCQNHRVVATITDAVFSSLGSSTPYTDGQYLYCFGYQHGFGEQSSLFRIDPENGEAIDLLENAPVQGLQLLGALNRDLVFFETNVTHTLPDPDSTVSSSEAITTGSITHWILNPDSGTWERFQTYSSDDGSLDRMFSAIVDGQYYQVDRQIGSVSVIDPGTGEATLITDQYPTDQLQGSFLIQDKVQDWLLFYAPSPMVNLQNGEIREKPSLPDNYWNGTPHQPNIYLNLGDTLLVDCRYEPYTRTDIGPDGTPAAVETNHCFLGLISAEDFMNGVPNYTEVGEYHG